MLTICMSGPAATKCFIPTAACIPRVALSVAGLMACRPAFGMSPKAGAGCVRRVAAIAAAPSLRVVWFGEELPARELNHVFAAASNCDVLFAIGTSGMVQPAASLPSLARRAGARVVQVNPMGTSLDDECSCLLRGSAGAAIPGLLQAAFPVVGSAET